MAFFPFFHVDIQCLHAKKVCYFLSLLYAALHAIPMRARLVHTLLHMSGKTSCMQACEMCAPFHTARVRKKNACRRAKCVRLFILHVSGINMHAGVRNVCTFSYCTFAKKHAADAKKACCMCKNMLHMIIEQNKNYVT